MLVTGTVKLHTGSARQPTVEVHMCVPNVTVQWPHHVSDAVNFDGGLAVSCACMTCCAACWDAASDGKPTWFGGDSGPEPCFARGTMLCRLLMKPHHA